jgi:hypothetical protein
MATTRTWSRALVVARTQRSFDDGVASRGRAFLMASTTSSSSSSSSSSGRGTTGTWPPTLHRGYANDPTISKGAFPALRKKHEAELNALRKQWREEFDLETRRKRDAREKESEKTHRERDERRREKLAAFEDKTEERRRMRQHNYERRMKHRVRTEHKLKQKMAATERRSRWRNVELYAEAEKWIGREQLEKRIEKALNRPEKMY